MKLQLGLGEGSSLVAGEGGFFVAASVQQPTELHIITVKTFFMWATTQKSAAAPAQLKYREGKKTCAFL